MTTFSIIDPPAYFVGRMIRLMRNDHRAAIDKVGVNAHRELRSIYDNSSYRRAWMINDQLAALGGVSGSLLDSGGYIWVVIAELARAYPMEMIKEARRQLAYIMSTRHEIATTVLPDDDEAVRLAVFLGFHVSHEGRGQPAVTRFGRRDLARYLKENTELRIPVGNSFAVPMGYHPDPI